MDIAGRPAAGRGHAARAGGARSSLALKSVAVEDVRKEVPLDELALPAGGLARAPGRKSVEVAHAAGGGLVEHLDGVMGEDVAIAAGPRHAVPQVLGRVLGRERVDVSRQWMRECSDR
ncbi:hypothetical protein [Anaeromyxobacter oryzisoli]|uniref:hypothetical protein n=1 Tax=Anaeromyxobacter oryzisoli TaxID=2925408 RepID=UPI001F59B1BE|nr:hypothetical protein [Anaeromyxobacter sp. SG63]